VGPHWAITYFLEVAKAADMCNTVRIHNQCKCCTSAEFAGCPNFFSYKMAHDKVFGIRCKIYNLTLVVNLLDIILIP